MTDLSIFSGIISRVESSSRIEPSRNESARDDASRNELTFQMKSALWGAKIFGASQGNALWGGKTILARAIRQTREISCSVVLIGMWGENTTIGFLNTLPRAILGLGKTFDLILEF
jgi:hypothetical protein